MGKPQLILDAGGVIVTNFPASFWEELARQAGTAVEELQQFFHRELKEPLWTGKIGEPAFWDMIVRRYPAVDPARARSVFLAGLRLLPAAGRLPGLSERFGIHLLSNHRPEWILDVLRPVLHCFSSLTISSEAGVCKPNPEIYRVVTARLPKGAPVLFIDDQEKNLAPARELGWQTMLADEEGTWLDRLEEWTSGV